VVDVTSEEFLALSERKRDAVVSEKAMEVPVVAWFGDEPCYYVDGSVTKSVPHYTTADDASCLLVDRMIGDDFGYVLHYRHDRKRWESTFDGMRYSAFAPTRALAIALAAAKALGIIG
jgi:hypothetical protein